MRTARRGYFLRVFFASKHPAFRENLDQLRFRSLAGFVQRSFRRGRTSIRLGVSKQRDGKKNPRSAYAIDHAIHPASHLRHLRAPNPSAMSALQKATRRTYRGKSLANTATRPRGALRRQVPCGHGNGRDGPCGTPATPNCRGRPRAAARTPGSHWRRRPDALGVLDTSAQAVSEIGVVLALADCRGRVIAIVRPCGSELENASLNVLPKVDSSL